jgi:hypothetical protein
VTHKGGNRANGATGLKSAVAGSLFPSTLKFTHYFCLDRPKKPSSSLIPRGSARTIEPKVEMPVKEACDEKLPSILLQHLAMSLLL